MTLPFITALQVFGSSIIIMLNYLCAGTAGTALVAPGVPGVGIAGAAGVAGVALLISPFFFPFHSPSFLPFISPSFLPSCFITSVLLPLFA